MKCSDYKTLKTKINELNNINDEIELINWNNDDWTYWCDDEELKGNVRYFIDRNKYFNEMFQKYEITTFDTSFDRDKVLNEIIDNLEELENGKKNTSKM